MEVAAMEVAAIEVAGMEVAARLRSIGIRFLVGGSACRPVLGTKRVRGCTTDRYFPPV
jgi:hypothetical protein